MSPENSDGTLVILRGNFADWALYDVATSRLLKELALNSRQEGEPIWDLKDPRVYYNVWNTTLRRCHVDTDAITTLHDFKNEFPAAACVRTHSYGAPSADQRYWAFMVQDTDWQVIAVIVYDMVADQIVGRKQGGFFDTVRGVSMSVSGRYCLFFHETVDYAGVASRDLSDLRALPRGCGDHNDLALTRDGRDVLVYQNVATDFIAMIDLETGLETALCHIPFEVNMDIGLHISGNCTDTPGWVLVSTYGALNPPAGSRHSWMDNQLFMLELKSNPTIWRIAHTQAYLQRDATGEKNFFAEAFASINTSATRVYWGSNWRDFSPNYSDTYAAELPANWVRLIPRNSVTSNEVAQKYTVLVGASVGNAWGLDGYFQRPDGKAFLTDEATPIYQFDKQDRLTELAERTGPGRPAAIILKECAAYFAGPDATQVGSLSTAEALVAGWVAQLRAAAIVPILATVVPINSRAGQDWEERLTGILRFNDWVREYARANHVPVLDLESGVRVSATDRSLRLDLDSGDGLHLNTAAYADYLNPLVMPVLIAAYNQQNFPPHAQAGPALSLRDWDTNGWEQVTLDGSASRDYDGMITNYVWRRLGAPIGSGVTTPVQLGLGTNLVTLIVTDNLGATNTDTLTVVVLEGDSSPPDAVANLAVFPANRKLFVHWTKSPSPDVTGYRVYVNGQLRANLPLTASFTVQNLSNGMAYGIGVVAVDWATNLSARIEATATPFGPPPETFLSQLFQKGVSPSAGYADCLDSVFRENVPGAGFALQAFGKAPSFSTRNKNGGTACLWFDLSTIPSQAIAEQARLRVWFQPSEFDAPGTLSLQRLLDPDDTGMWQENPLVDETAYDVQHVPVESNQMGSASFKRVGVPWSSASEIFTGALSPSVRLSREHQAGVPEWLEFDVTDDVQSFLNDWAANLGWVLSTTADDTVYGQVYTADHPEAAKRPQLHLVYSMDTQLRLRFISFANLQPRIEITGLPGQSFILQSSSNLVLWTSLATNHLVANSFIFSDSPSVAAPMMFYRAQLLDPNP
jgi:hypothetical protein